MNWNEDFKKYAVDIAIIYNREPESIMNCLRFKSVSGSLNESYLSLVREKQLIPLELLNHSEKIRLWEKAKCLGTDKQDCINISRSIYLLEQLTQ